MINFISHNIKYLCEKNSLSQSEFGELFSTKQSTIATYISGRSNPTIEMIQKICRHFELNIDDFINLDLSAIGAYSNKQSMLVATEPATAYNSKDEIIKSQRETIEVQKQLIENLREQLGHAS